MRIRITHIAHAICCVALVVTCLWLPTKSEAIPAWSRKYDMDCSSCHFGSTNRLTKFGRDFLWRGQRTPDATNIDDAEDLSWWQYMSFASKFRFEQSPDETPETKFDVEALSIYSGGPLYENFSYFFEIYLHERGKAATSGGGQLDTAVRSKLAEAYLQYNSNPQGENYWFARAGSYTPRIIHTASTGGRVSISRPRILNDNVGGGNLFTPRDRFYGVAFGFKTKENLFGEFGITNGGGGNARPNIAENNEMKDIWGSLEFLFDEFGSSFGVYGYSGEFPVTGPPAFGDEFTRFGVMASLVRDNFEVSGGWFSGQNDLAAGGSRNPHGYYLEAAFLASPTTAFYGRYDFFDPDLSPEITGGAIGLSYRLNKVGRMVFEQTWSKVSGGATTNKFTFELNWMF